MAFIFKWMQNNFFIKIFLFEAEFEKNEYLNKKYSLMINNSYQLIFKVQK